MRASSKKTVFAMTKMLSIIGILAVVGCATVTPEEAVLKANLAAIGGADALNNVTTISRSGDVFMDGQFGAMDGTAKQALIHGEKAYAQFDLGIFAQTQGYDGTTAWQDNSMQGIKDLEGEEADQIIQGVNVSLLADRYLNGDVEGLTLVEDESVGEDACSVLQEASLDENGVDDGKGVKFYISQASGLLVRVVLHQDSPQFGPVVITVDYSDYADHGGVQLPGKNKIVLGDFITLEYEYSETTVNGELDDAMFNKPGA